MKKLIDFVAGLALVCAFVAAMASVGAFELGNIGAGRCIIQAGACLTICVALGVLNALLLEAVEERRAR